MSFRATQPNFSRGELGPQLRGRFDADVWQASLERARNVFVLKYGGISKRPGMQLVAEVLDDSAPTRLIPFQFSTEQTYALEFGQGYMAPLALGGRVLQEELLITGITSASSAQVTVAYHGYAVGDYIWLDNVDGEMGELLNNRAWPIVTIVDENNFVIGANTAGLTFTGAIGGTARTSAPAPDPTPPVVSPPVTEPDPPTVGGGGGGSFGGGRIDVDKS